LAIPPGRTGAPPVNMFEGKGEEWAFTTPIG